MKTIKIPMIMRTEILMKFFNNTINMLLKIFINKNDNEIKV